MASSSTTRSFHASPSAPALGSSAAAPLPFAPTLGMQSRQSQPASLRVSDHSARLTTPLAAPPPPLVLSANPASTNEERKVRYAGAEHTLGPTFSEEEDGDDSEWIAGRMAAVLNMGGPAGNYATGQASTRQADPHARARQQVQANIQAQQEARMVYQLQQQQFAQLHIQAQQQQLLQVIAVGQQTGRPTQHYREAYATLQIQAQQLALSTAQLQSQTQLVVQAQAHRALLAQQIQPPSQRSAMQPTSDYRSAVAAQVQANLLARNSRSRQPVRPDEADIRARFESVPNPYITPQTASAPLFEPAPSPFGDLTWKSSTPKPSPFDQSTRSAPPQAGRFDPPGSATPADRLPAFLARRRATDETSISGESDFMSVSDTPGLTRAGTAQTSPNPSIGESERYAGQNLLGKGRPDRLLPSARAYTVPAAAQAARRTTEATPRSASHTGAAANVKISHPLRQPQGPPGDPAELKEKNFQTMLRRQAGLMLNMLGRRTEGPLIPIE